MINWTNSKVLVCGGAGFVGSHMARELVKRGSEVTVVDNLSSGSKKNIDDLRDSIKFIQGDLRNKTTCMKLTNNRPDVIFQFAANMGGIGYITSIGADIMHDSAMANLNMLEVARQSQTSHYFYSSSACIYPEYRQKETEVVPLAEHHAYPAEPDQFYGWEKLFTEKLCEAYQKDYGMNIRIARFHNIFGECYTSFDKEKGKAPGHMIMKAIKHPNPPFIIWGDGKQTRSFLYIDDCIEGVLRLMESDYDKPVNIGSDYLVDMNYLAKVAIELTGKDIEIGYDLDRPQGVRGRNSDNTLVKEVLGWEPKVSLEEGMRRTYEWAVEHYSQLENI